MSRHTAVFVIAVATVVAAFAALGLTSAGAGSADEVGGPWACAGAEPLVGVCLDNPFDVLDSGLL